MDSLSEITDSDLQCASAPSELTAIVSIECQICGLPFFKKGGAYREHHAKCKET